MAQRAAIASGNWSNPAIWNGGVLPEPGDIVASNGFTVTIDQNINVDSITNAATTVGTEVPLMTSNTAPSGIASNSGTGGFANFSAHLSFDRSGALLCYYPGPFTGDWIAYEFATAKKIGRFGVSFNGGSNTVSYSLEAWNGSTWIVIGTHTANGAFTYSPVFVNTTAYLKYRIVLSGTNTGAQIVEFYLYDALSVSAVAGGTFILNNGVTVTLTGTTSISQGSVTVLTVPVTTGNTSTLIGNNFVRANVSNQPLILLSGAGTFNVTGTIVATSASSPGITITGVNSTLNYTGSINAGTSGSSHGISTDVVCTINLVGTILGGMLSNGVFGLRFNSTGVFTLVGSAVGGFYGSDYGVYLNNTTATITGDLYGGNGYDGSSVGLQADNNANITMTGVMYGRLSSAFRSSSNIYLNHYGTINCTGLAGIVGSQSSVAISSTGAGAIHILTGPFISSPTGIQPLYISRMHYRRTIGSYYEFRNNSTNGALPPAASAPATRLVSPDTVADSPIPANVRQGTVYSLGSQTGTMIVPSPSNVANNVPVDNTVGTAVLDPNAIWAVPLTSINTLNSIGRRVKNAATVETTGAQIQTTLNNNE
jgi:hypothetical protein